MREEEKKKKKKIKPGKTYHMSDVKDREEVERTLIAHGHVLLCSMTMPTPWTGPSNRSDRPCSKLSALSGEPGDEAIGLLEQSMTSKMARVLELTI